MNDPELENLLLECAQKLTEHFDAVQIVASTVDERGTVIFLRGSGNWYARRAMCEEFIERDQAKVHAIIAETERKRGEEP